MKIAILFIFSIVVLVSTNFAFAAHHEVISPLQQIKDGIPSKEVVCKHGLALMIRTSGDAACIKEDSVSKLQDRGWILEKQAVAKTSDKANLVVQNAKIYTVDEQRSWQEALAVKDGKIIKVGTNADVESLIGTHTTLIDAKGQLVLPAFHDLHMHPSVVVNRFATACVLPQSDASPTTQMFLDEVQKCVKENPDDEWIIGFGGPSAILDDVTPISELDKISPDRPLFITDETGHNGWANSLAFEAAQITKDTPNPPNSEFVKDSQGELSGKIIEISATEMIWKVVPPTSMDEKKEALAAIIEFYNSLGFVGLTDLKTIKGQHGVFAAADGELNAYLKLYNWSVNYGGADAIVWADDILADLQNYKFNNIDAMGAKIFIDGTFEGYTAATLEPYEEQPDNFGILTLSPEKLREIVFDLDEKGFQISTHAIGDKGVRTILDAYEELKNERGDSMGRHRVTHGYMIDSQDRNRFAELGVGYDADFNAAAPNDLAWNQRIQVGDVRIQEFVPLGDLYRSGVIMGFGVDWPVQNPSPFPAIQNAVTRTDDNFPERGVLGENQEISVEAAVEMFTINGAWLQQLEDVTGSIEEGKNADFVIVDQNIFEIPEGDISKTKVIQTYFQGNKVYDSLEQPQENFAEQVTEMLDEEFLISFQSK